MSPACPGGTLNINGAIPFAQITKIVQLARGHPVFRCHVGPEATAKCFVAKFEMAQKRSFVQDPIEVMREIDTTAKARILDRRELQQFVAAAARAEVEDKGKPGFNIFLHEVSSTPALPGVRPGPQNRQGQSPTFVIVMPFKAGLMNLEDAAAREGGSKEQVRHFAATFKEQGTLEKLGEIIAVDAFMGNFDRINFNVWKDPPEQARSVDGVQLKCMQNFGNFFISKEGGAWAPIGYDNVDYTSQFKDLSMLPDGAFYPGVILKTDQAALRQRVARAVFDDFNTLLGPRNRSVFKVTAKRTYMPSNGVPRILAGIESGAGKLLNYLRGRYVNGGISPELQRRLHACGWLTRTNFPRLT